MAKTHYSIPKQTIDLLLETLRSHYCIETGDGDCDNNSTIQALTGELEVLIEDKTNG